MDLYIALKHSIVLCLFICGVTTIYFASKKASEQQKWLLLTLVCTFITVLEYYQEIRAVNPTMMISAIKVGHSFKILATLCYLQFVSVYCRIKMPKAIQYSFLIINSAVIGTILTFEKHALFYTFYRISYYKSMPYVIIKPGIMYFFFVYGLTATMSASIGILFCKMMKAHDREKTRLFFMMCAGFLPILGVATQKILGLQIVDLVPIGFALAGLVLLVVVKRYGLLDVVLSAKENIVENTKEGVIVIDNEYNILYANPAVKESYASILQLDTEGKQDFKAMFDNPESVYTKTNGIYEIRVSDIYEDKVKRGKMAWIFDMSFINNYTKEIMQLKEEAEQANQAKTTFLANMSHEIRTPMNAILGFAELILQKSVKEEIRDHAYDIKHSAENLLHIINEILDISKIESGKQEIVEEEYYTQSLLEDVMVIIENQTKQKGLEFISHIDEQIPFKLFGPLVQIREIMINVLNNAVKYTKSGHVMLDARFEITDVENSKGMFYFKITDTGIGMKPEDVATIYDRFRKFDETANKGIEGSGLGMYIVKTLLTRMQGTIDVDSVLGEGTTITITIPQNIIDAYPIGKMDMKFREEEVYKKQEFTTTAKILVVDDNEVNLKVVAGLLNKYDIHPDKAIDGYKALEMVQKENYDLIFMDHMMPGMDGVETLREIRKLDGVKYKKVPIVLLTANAIAGVKEKMISIGFNGYLSKPIDIAKMEKVLLKLIPADKIHIIQRDEDDFMNFDKILSRSSNILRHMEVDNGVKNCGNSLSDYIDVLEIVEKYGEDRAKQLEDLLKKKEYEAFTINVHALKSTALNIGATELGGLAQALEDAGKKKNYAFLIERSKELIYLYKTVLMEIRRFLVMKQHTDNIVKEESFSMTALHNAILKYEELKEKRESYLNAEEMDEDETKLEEKMQDDMMIAKSELQEILYNVKNLIDLFEQDQAIQVLQELQSMIQEQEVLDLIQQTLQALENFDMEQATFFIQEAIAYTEK